MKLTFVVPRYGPDIIGGAETAARLLAEHLVTQKGWDVSVLTSCARDFRSWDNFFPPGDESVNGVRVRRFTVVAGRDPGFEAFSAMLLDDPEQASIEDAEQWVELQGPVVPDLVEAASASDAEVLACYPYLYYPTVRIVGEVPVPTILHPAAHDETALRLPVFSRVFEAADGLVYHTAAERDLVQSLFPVAAQRQLLLGLGVDDEPDGVAGEGGIPYLLCLGRVDRGKGTTLLAGLFSRYKDRHPGPLRLVLAGPLVHPPPDHPDIELLGPVDESEKWRLLAGAVALVSPSSRESFSLVVAESWSAGVPVLANAACAATVEQCRRSGGGLAFADFGEFEVGVELLTGDDATRRRLGALGRSYVGRWFRWPRVVERYARFVEEVAAAHA
ncbi:MAG: glycosyltransferase family 4 protein [Acidimicrobiales bacterium]